MGRLMDVSLAVRATADLAADERARVIDLCVAAHDEDDFRNLFSYIPSGGRHFLAFRGDEMVSHAVVTERWLRLPGERRLRTAYVDAVATLPGEQRRGYASALMRLLAASIDDYQLGCLETDRPAFYERLGWEAWRGPLAGLSAEGILPTPDQQGVMVLRVARSPRLDLEGPLMIECDGGRIW